MSLPHIDVGTSARNAERFFASGNERTPTDMTTPAGANVGYYIRPGDKMHYIIELMNMNKASKKVYMTLTWEYVKGTPAGYQNIRPVWLDAFQCGLSDVEPKKQEGNFDITAHTWTANFKGKLMGMGGHLHDGGDYLDIVQNGKKLCRAAATYGAPTMGGDMAGMSGGGGGGGKKKGIFGGLKGILRLSQAPEAEQLKDSTSHIEKISWCGTTNETPLGEMNKGDKWDIAGHYDYDKYPGMLRTNGKQSDVMAIAVMMVAVPLSQNRAGQ
jgi:hypothetical protein